MTEQQIKKAVELAEGFEYNSEYVCYPNGDRYEKGGTLFEACSIYSAIREWEHYPLLLYRAMRGWNQRKPDYAIYLEGQVTYKTITNDIIELNTDDYQGTPYLTAQEQALEVALEEVLL